MILLIYLSAIMACIIGSIIKVRTPFLNVFIIFIITYLMGRPSDNPDTINYYILYENISSSGYFGLYEPGYIFMQKLGVFLGLNYPQFRVVTVFFSLLLINNFATTILGRKVYVFYLFYLLFLVFIDTVQLRAFISFSIVLFGLKYIVKSYSNKSTIRTTIFILLAFTVHVSSIVFLVLIIPAFKSRKLILTGVVSLTIISCLLLFVFESRLGFVKDVINLVTGGSERTAEYGSTSVRFGFLYAFTLHLLGVFFIYLLKVNVSYRRLIKKDDFLVHFLDFVFMVNLITIVFFPLYMFELQFIRLTRCVSLLNIILLSLFLVKNDSFRIRSLISWVAVIVITLSWLYYTMIVGKRIDTVLLPFFDENTFLSFWNR